MTPPLYPLPSSERLNRRSFLVGTASFAAALLTSRARGAVTASPKFSAYPFSLGVASGDPLPDGVVLWTRLAPRPLVPGGGMPVEPVEVSWMIADDEAMTQVVQRGTVEATPDWAHSVHVEVTGLRPDRWYWYQFKAGGEVSPKGRTRTMPPAEALPEKLSFAFASCQQYEIGYYTAYEHMAREGVDLIVHLGDYIYEGKSNRDSLRPHHQPELFTIDQYRARYAVYKSDPALQAAHAVAPWIVTWDDHEVSNNYANDIPERPMARDKFLRRRAAGYQAYFEHMPLRRSQLPRGPEMLLYRDLSFGRLARFQVLDTRQYRTDQPQGDGAKPPSDVLMDPRGTLLGSAQRDWLFRGLESSPTTWNVLAQQVMMARVDKAKGPAVTLSMDQWPGYEFERRRILKQLQERPIKNPVVITGDIHSHWANELAVDFDGKNPQNVAVEFVGTSITSGGDGVGPTNVPPWVLGENPCVKFFNAERGYVRCEVTPQLWRTDYRTVPYVSKRGAPLNTRAKFAVESGRPQLLPV